MRWSRGIILGLAVIAAPFCVSCDALAAPSFDCAKADTSTETIICHSEALSALDAELGVAYVARRNQLSGAAKEALTGDQRTWMARRALVCEVPSDYSTIGYARLENITSCLSTYYSSRVSILKRTSVHGAEAYYHLVMSADDAICQPLLDVYEVAAASSIETRVEQIDEDAPSGERRAVYKNNVEWEAEYHESFSRKGFNKPNTVSTSDVEGNFENVYDDDIFGDGEKRIFYIYRMLSSKIGTRETVYVFRKNFTPSAKELESIDSSWLEFFVDFLGNTTPVFAGSKYLNLDLVPIQGYVLRKWKITQKSDSYTAPASAPSIMRNTLQRALKYNNKIIFVARQENNLENDNVILVYRVKKSREMEDVCYIYHSKAR